MKRSNVKYALFGALFAFICRAILDLSGLDNYWLEWIIVIAIVLVMASILELISRKRKDITSPGQS